MKKSAKGKKFFLKILIGQGEEAAKIFEEIKSRAKRSGSSLVDFVLKSCLRPDEADLFPQALPHGRSESSVRPLGFSGGVSSAPVRGSRKDFFVDENTDEQPPVIDETPYSMGQPHPKSTLPS
jgi:hypothetical protein